MKTAICHSLGIDMPIFAFSHCRDVVAEVTKAGGMGVLGISGFTVEQLAQELDWLDTHTNGLPYGVDLLMPNNYQDVGHKKLDRDAILPKDVVDFMNRKLDEAGIARLPENERDAMLRSEDEHTNVGTAEAAKLFDLALQHPRVKLVVSALGTPSKHFIDLAHEHGVLVGALVGKVEHALAQKAAGVDMLIAQGMEAGGHTGSLTSMVLWPQIVDAVAPMPVLAAGGIGRGRQMAAAMALGAEGVWCGSVWLGTRESELQPGLKQRLFDARSEDALQTRAHSGKPMRALRSKYSDVWNEPGAPSPLPMPLQFILNHESTLRIKRAGAVDWMFYPVGQIVGDMKQETSVRQVIHEFLEEFITTADRLQALVAEA